MENQNISSKVIGNFRYSFKKLFTLWLPIIFLLSTIISIAYIFGVREEASYLGSSLPSESNIWLTILLAFLSLNGASFWVVTILLCSLIHFLVVEVFSIIRLFKLRKIEQSGLQKMLSRFLMAQVIGIGVFFASYILIYTASFGVAYVYGYGDLKTNVKEALNGTITDDQEIIKLIQTSSSVIDVYGASNELGVVLAKRDLQKKDQLSAYEGRVLPVLVKFAGKDKEGGSFFVPSTNSVVFTNFRKDHSEKILMELVFNRLKHHPSPVVVSAFKNSQRPTVIYLDDQAYASVVKKKLDQRNEKALSDRKTQITAYEKYVSECWAYVAAHGKSIDQKVIATCQGREAELASGYKELEQLKADVKKQESIDLKVLEGESTSGTYFIETQTIYMRVAPHLDAFIYLRTLLHEMLHHYSKTASELPLFINEGITDYATFKTFKMSDDDITSVSGYSKEVQTIMALLEKIPEQEIMTAYFTNSAKMFETAFKQAFPGVDYKTFLSKREAFGKQDMRVFLGLDAEK